MNRALKHSKRILHWLCIGLYAAVYVGWDLLHARVHYEEQAVHSMVAEKDACHRSIFHGEKDTHKGHVAAFKYCPSCHVMSAPPLLTDLRLPSDENVETAEYSTTQSVFADQSVNSLFSSRAPPSVV